MVKIISMILMLAVSVCADLPPVVITSGWQFARYFCNFEETPARFNAIVYSTCLWQKSGIVNERGSLDQALVSRFLDANFGSMPDFEIIQREFHTCFNKVVGINLEDKSLNLWFCVNIAGILGRMDKPNPENTHYDVGSH